MTDTQVNELLKHMDRIGDDVYISVLVGAFIIWVAIGLNNLLK